MSEEQNGKRPLAVTVKCQYDGFGFDVEAHITSGQIPSLIERLRELGIEPANSPYVWAGQPQDRLNNTGEPDVTHGNGYPVCRIHGKPMKASKKGGHYCTSKLADGTYCSETA